MHQYVPTPVYHPTTPLIDDSDTPNAGNFNPTPEALADNIAYLLQRVGMGDGLNWPHGLVPWASMVPPVSGLTSPTLVSPTTAPIWDPKYSRWLLGVNNGTAFNGAIYYSYDGFNWYDEFNPGNPYILGLAIKPDGTVLMIGGATAPGSTGAFSSQLNVSTGAYSAVTAVAPSTAFATPALGNWYSGVWLPATSTWSFWQGGGTGAPIVSTDGINWTAAATWVPPASFVIHTLAQITGTAFLMLFPSGTTVVSAYMVSSDGTNWNQQAMPALNAGESVIDACYDATNALYYMLTSTSGPTGISRLWQSATGLAGGWTVVSTINHLGLMLACGQGGELLIQALVYQGTGTGFIRFFQSYDAGTTWRYSAFGDWRTPLAGHFCSLVSNGSQFLYLNDRSGYASSLAIGPTVRLV